jgi:phage shock protein C
MSTEHPTPPSPQPPKQLYRTRDDQMIAGVCGGLARYLGVDPTLVRVVAVIALVFAFPATLVGYVLAWAIMPTNQAPPNPPPPGDPGISG